MITQCYRFCHFVLATYGFCSYIAEISYLNVQRRYHDELWYSKMV